MRESNLQRRVLSQVWVARPASVRLQTLRGGLSCGGKEGKGVLVSPALSSAALPPSPQRRAGEAHGCGWVAGLGGALLAHLPPPSSLLFLFQARQLPRNPLHSVTSRGRQSPSLPTAFWQLLHPRLGHLREIQAIPRKVRLSSLFPVKESDESQHPSSSGDALTRHTGLFAILWGSWIPQGPQRPAGIEG